MEMGIKIPNDGMRGTVQKQDVPEGVITCQLTSSYLYTLLLVIVHIIRFSIIAQYTINTHNSAILLYKYSVEKMAVFVRNRYSWKTAKIIAQKFKIFLKLAGE